MIAIISQARINSTRLPNKIFLEAAGKSFLSHHIDRLQSTGLPVIIATTNDGSEKPIIDFCNEANLKYFQGDERDVLDRYYKCASAFGVTTIIRVTSDCPLIDGHIIRKGLSEYLALRGDVYYSNAIDRSYPRGMDYEIFSFDLLKEAYEKAVDPSDREHVTPYIWKNRTGRVKVINDVQGKNTSSYRVTLDTEEDQTLITKLIEDYNASMLDLKSIENILSNHPDLIAINQNIEQKKV